MKTLRAPLVGSLLAISLGIAAVSSAHGQAPRADPADTESMDAILHALYDVISGPAGEARDWDRFRSLFIPEAQFIPTGMQPDGAVTHRVLDVEGFITGSGSAIQEQGFYEAEIARTVDRFGPVVHAFSTYESRRTANDPEPFMRGINSIQLMEAADRWWIVSVYWHNETPRTPLPTQYLPGGGF